MMKINKFTNKKVAISLITLFLLAGASLYALEKLQITNFISSPADTTGPTAEQARQQEKVDNEAKRSLIEEEVPANTPPVAPKSSDDIVITAQQEADGNVTVLTKLYGFPDGECSLVIQNGTKNTTKTAEIIYQPEFSSCAGFTVAKSDLGAGTWTLTLSAKTSGSELLTKTQTLEVK